MEFTKVHWFYETTVHGVEVSVQRTKDNKKWEASGARGQIVKGNTRKEAVEKWLEVNKGQYTEKYGWLQQ
jgi:hypothetical protein